MEIGQLVVKLLIQNNRHILLLQLGYLKTPDVSQGDFNPSPAEVSL